MLFSFPTFRTLAYDFEVDGMYYNITSSEDLTVAVTYLYDGLRNSEAYSGSVVIPSQVTYDGNTYSVTSIGNEAFYCGTITSIDIPNTITSIGKDAFNNCASLTSIEIPNSVTSIGELAFRGSSLTSIEIPSSVTSIGNNALLVNSLTEISVAAGNKYFCAKDGVLFTKDMTGLIQYPIGSTQTSYDIPNTVTSIEMSAFHECTSITSISIPNSVTSIAYEAFEQCENLASITFGDNSQLTSIGSYAFDSCTSLPSIVIPSTVTSIGKRAFSDCSSLTEIVIPSAVTSIGDYAFQGCTSLASVTFGDNSQLTSIGTSAFSDCSSLTDIVIPNSVTSIGESAFDGCTSLSSIEIPSRVTSIGSYAFYQCKSLTSIEIPKGITSIKTNTFYNCTSLALITSLNPEPPACYNDAVFDGVDKTTCVLSVPEGSVDAYASADVWKDFLNVTEFTGSFSVVNDNGITVYYDVTSVDKKTVEVTYLAYNSSSNSSAYTGDVAIPQSVTYNGTTYTVEGIGDYAFYDCTGLTGVTIPESVTYIDDYAFYGSGLKEIEIPSSVTSIGAYVFEACLSLASITFGDNSQLTKIGNYTFYGCTGLVSIEIPNGITSIGDYAFYGCTSLISIEIPSSVGDIGKNMFGACTSLTKIDVAAGNESLFSLDGVLYYKDDVWDIMELITYPAGKTDTSFTIPSNVEYIFSYAFYCCTNLTSVTIPSSVYGIYDYAFYGCSNLAHITSLNPEPPACYTSDWDAGTQVFEGVDKTACVLSVPEGSKDAYASANGWCDFFNIEDTEVNGIEAVAADAQGKEVSGYYTIGGQRINAPAKGVNIVKYSDGTTKKVLAK